MASPKYSSIPPPRPDHDHHHDHLLHQPPQPIENYVVLPSYCSSENRRWCTFSLHTFLGILGILSLSLFLLYPSDPDLKIVRLKLKHLRVHTRPHISVDVSVATRVMVSNHDAFSVDFNGIHVAIWYRGKELGYVTSKEGHVRAWGSSYVDAVAELNGVEIIHDWVHLLEDLIKGTVPFDAVSSFNGRLRLYFVEVPLEAKISCEMDVNVKNETITHQSCYSE